MRRRSRSVIGMVAVALLAGLTVTVGSPVDASAPDDARASTRNHDFPDVTNLNPFHEDISWMVDQGFASGYADGLFHPGDPVSRQAMVQMLWKMSDAPAGPFPPEPFTDVAPGHAFYTAITWAYSNGVIGGYADGTFRPTNSVSRQAMGSMLHDLSGLGTYGHPFFADVPSSHAFYEDISWWVATGTAQGYSDGTFRPTIAVSRQAASRFFANFYEMMGGYWPYIDHHTHVCETEPTPEQEQAAADLLDDAKDAVADLYPTKAAALAAGYHVTAPPFGGAGSHMVNTAFSSDGIALDVTKPESLVMSGTNDNVVAAEMFVREYVGPGPMWPPEPGGCITLWHGHDNLCYTTPFLGGGSVAGIAGICGGGTMLRVTPEMLHVWVDAAHAGDPFEGIET